MYLFKGSESNGIHGQNCIAGLAITCVRVWDGMFRFFNLASNTLLI